uniref:Uncharacterized protein n=1 Tax=Daucus carota subsp. sativus TaxID=79200 RepID=A0A166G298_DAUCS
MPLTAIAMDMIGKIEPRSAHLLGRCNWSATTDFSAGSCSPCEKYDIHPISLVIGSYQDDRDDLFEGTECVLVVFI